MNVYIYPRLYGPLRAWAYQPTIGLISTILEIEAKDHADSLEVTFSQPSSPPVVVGFLNQDQDSKDMLFYCSQLESFKC